MKASLLSLLFLLASCGASSAPEPAEPAQPSGSGPDAVKQQAGRGAELYGAHCAGCHGKAGQGSAKAPPVVGKEALPLDPRPGAKRDVPFKTALDVFNWVKTNMPGKAPGSLSDDEYVAILAFDLQANGVQLEHPLDGEQAATIQLH